MEREVLKRENTRLTGELAAVRTQLAVARAWVRFHYGTDVESMDLTWLEDESDE